MSEIAVASALALIALVISAKLDVPKFVATVALSALKAEAIVFQLNADQATPNLLASLP